MSVHMRHRPNIWYHTLEQLEQMNHQAVPLVFKSISPHGHSVSCPACVVHLNRRVKRVRNVKSVCSGLIMIFPFISSPSLPPSLLPSHSPSLHEDPTSLGRDVLPLKLHGEFRLCPSPRLPQQHATVSSPPPLPLICLLVHFQHMPQSL